MAEINKHSAEWARIVRFAEQEREDAIEALIADRDSEQQRGAIAVLDRLLKLAEEPPKPIPSIQY